MRKSRIDIIFESEGFRPFDAPEALVVIGMIEKHVKVPPVTAEQIIRAVQSLSALNLMEVTELSRIQDKFCKRCGNCCRESHPIDFRKEVLRAVAKSLGTSYKKLKKKLRAYPRGEQSIIEVPGKPCPFLKGRNICTIYHLRPFVCRLYPLGKTMSNIFAGQVVQLMPPSKCPAIYDILTALAILRIMEERIVHEQV